ncbi:unnamed protein product [Absidia cylindrospora]
MNENPPLLHDKIDTNLLTLTSSLALYDDVGMKKGSSRMVADGWIQRAMDSYDGLDFEAPHPPPFLGPYWRFGIGFWMLVVI